MKQCQKQLGIEDKLINHKSILAEISRAKDSLISPEEYKQTAQNDFRKSKIAECYELYQAQLKKSDAMDFDDIIFNTVSFLRKMRTFAIFIKLNLSMLWLTSIRILTMRNTF